MDVNKYVVKSARRSLFCDRIRLETLADWDNFSLYLFSVVRNISYFLSRVLLIVILFRKAVTVDTFREITHVTRLCSFSSSVNDKCEKLQSGFVAGLVNFSENDTVSRCSIVKRHRCGETLFRMGPYSAFFALLVVPNISILVQYSWSSSSFFLTLIRSATWRLSSLVLSFLFFEGVQ